MARTGRNYGHGGTEYDEYGILPSKRIENMQGIDGFGPVDPFDSDDLRAMIISFCYKHGKKPKKLIYPGLRVPSPGFGMIIVGLGFVWVDYVNVPNAEVARLE